MTLALLSGVFHYIGTMLGQFLLKFCCRFLFLGVPHVRLKDGEEKTLET